LLGGSLIIGLTTAPALVEEADIFAIAIILGIALGSFRCRRVYYMSRPMYASDEGRLA
jgi:hypothetical protein